MTLLLGLYATAVPTFMSRGKTGFKKPRSLRRCIGAFAQQRI
jgi:hypothetical protein